MTDKFDNFHDSPFEFDPVPIIALKKRKVNDEKVYNLTVSNKKEFVANGILVHNCHDCSKYAGKVKRASYWQKIGAHPQSPDLECKGIKCDCRLSVTTKPLSRGYLTPPGA